MPRYAFLTIGFEKPTPDIMSKWSDWFAEIQDHIVEQIGLFGGREISADGVSDLKMDADAVTGVMIIEAADREEAERLASSNPYITSIRVYETMAD